MSFPITLTNPKVLLIGAGKIGFKRATSLQKNGIVFEVISSNFDENFHKLDVKKTIKNFEISDARDYNIVVDSTGSKKVLDLLLEEKQKRFLLINVSADQKYCDFFFSSILYYGKLKIAVTSGGSSPSVIKVVKQKISEIIPEKIETLCEESSQDRLNGIINKEKTELKTKRLFNPIYLIGCGLGDVELLSIKAYKIIQNLDVVFYDNLISKEILEIIPKSTEKIFVGKSKNNHSLVQGEINNLLLKYAKSGKKIARLKSGDPYIFGRGYEEYEFLTSHDFSVEVISGISSAIAGPSLANIPLTHRGVSNSFSVVSAHLKDGAINLYWMDLLKREKHTTVVLMGLSCAKYIEAEAKNQNIDMNYKVAIVGSASRTNQVVIKTTIANLHEKSRGVSSPAILIFGDVTQLKGLSI
ncbi:MAG: Uroporphyrinogen-III methyltransferase (EC [uncultured Campylobacterales bacterium]|uniref:Uroporphyrinogen-III methyltransferase (EC) n=1 Tax=uncultured Campylobacterales bacterium TaxID=352960 RepID=A0A6S6SE77_9BACT|nr:MAG: Uroporphyrinogen-III methyltransferase (EC [uncultured Campylobacterales bacterium]